MPRTSRTEPPSPTARRGISCTREEGEGGGVARRLLTNQPDPPLPLPLYSHPTPPRTRPRSSLCAALVYAPTHPLSSCLVQPLCARGSTAAGRAVRVRRRFATTSIRARTHTHTHQAGGSAAAAPSGAGTMPTPPLATRSTNGKATCTATPPADVIAAGALFTSTPPPALCLCPTPVLSPPFLRRRRRRTTSYGGRHSLSPSAQYNAHVLSPPRILLPVHPSPSTSLSAGPPHPPILRHRTH